MSVALITGGSSGIGAAFARVLAAEGSDLVIVARDEARLRTEQTALVGRFGVDVEVVTADLSTDAGCDRVVQRLVAADRPVTTLVNNAGRGVYQPFGEQPLTDEEDLLNLNARAVLRLTHAAVRVMRERGGGEIVNVSSVSGFVPRGIGATYAASKAWVTSFSECLSQQLTGSGVRVCAVCPGFVRTDFHRRAELDRGDVPAWMWLEADAVARQGLADARRGRPVSVPGRQYRALLGAARILPRPVLRRVLRGRTL